MSTKTTLQIQLRRVGWLLFIWASSVLTLAIVASLFRGLMTLAGLTV
jgi:hypothetical protein